MDEAIAIAQRQVAKWEEKNAKDSASKKQVNPEMDSFVQKSKPAIVMPGEEVETSRNLIKKSGSSKDNKKGKGAESTRKADESSRKRDGKGKLKDSDKPKQKKKPKKNKDKESKVFNFFIDPN